MEDKLLPSHGRAPCNTCFNCSVEFDNTQKVKDDWRITSNPLAWGNINPEIIVLGFSKGPTQKGALTSSPHNEIAYKGSRVQVGKILAHVGLVPPGNNDYLRTKVDQLIADENGPFHFASLIRCAVERYDQKSESWKGSGGGMLDKFAGTAFGQEITRNCISEHLLKLPSRTKLVLLFGMGSKCNYVRSARKMIEQVRGGSWKTINEVAYTDGKVTFVHLEHFASQGALLPNWLGQNEHPRSRFGKMAQEAVNIALS